MADESVYAACADPRQGVKPTHIGGQAVIEGVMMRGKKTWALSVRDPQGVIHTEENPLILSSSKHEWMRWPMVRGVVALVESLELGMKALSKSAEIAGFDDETGEELSPGALIGAMALGLGLAIVIFIVLPAVITNLIVGEATQNPTLWNIVDGILRVVAFVLYVWLIGFMPDLKRVFMYHGAEHKVIHAVEHGDELTVENAQRYPTMHVRCGTSFLLMVMLVSILMFSFVPIKAMALAWGVTNSWALTGILIASRLILMPLVAGISYEITVKWAGPRAHTPLVRVLMWPGLQTQRMTTREPTDDMIEVAIASMAAVIASEAPPVEEPAVEAPPVEAVAVEAVTEEP